MAEHSKPPLLETKEMEKGNWSSNVRGKAGQWKRILATIGKRSGLSVTDLKDTAGTDGSICLISGVKDPTGPSKGIKEGSIVQCNQQAQRRILPY